jgi:hypothetical protein
MVRLVEIVRAIRAVCAVLFVFAQLSCAKTASEKSAVTIQFPKPPSGSSSQKLGGGSTPSWAEACFIANISGDGIPAQKSNNCEIETAIFAGSVAAGGALTLEVPRGENRKLEVFAYFRANSNDPCPTLTGGFGSLDRTQVARIGTNPNFSTNANEVTVPVTVSLPTAGVDLLTQYSLPATCVASANPKPGSPNLSVGGGRLTSAAFVVQGRLNSSQKEVQLSSSPFKVHLTEQGQ